MLNSGEAKRMRKIMRDHGYNIKLLAEAVGMPANTVGIVVNLKRMATRSTISKITRVLGAEAGRILAEQHKV